MERGSSKEKKEYIPALAERLKRFGLRATPQRLAILAFLEGNTSHPSAEEIFRELKPRLPSLSLATVYGTLEVLRREGKSRSLLSTLSGSVLIRILNLTIIFFAAAAAGFTIYQSSCQL